MRTTLVIMTIIMGFCAIIYCTNSTMESIANNTTCTINKISEQKIIKCRYDELEFP